MGGPFPCPSWNLLLLSLWVLAAGGMLDIASLPVDLLR